MHCTNRQYAPCHCHWWKRLDSKLRRVGWRKLCSVQTVGGFSRSVKWLLSGWLRSLPTCQPWRWFWQKETHLSSAQIWEVVKFAVVLAKWAESAEKVLYTKVLNYWTLTTLSILSLLDKKVEGSCNINIMFHCYWHDRFNYFSECSPAIEPLPKGKLVILVFLFMNEN